MRIIRRESLLVGLALLAAGGCKWTDFDDLKEDTWVTSTGRPDTLATNWGVALARVQRDGSGGTLAVLGASEAIYNDVVVGPNGDVNITNELELNTQFAIGNLAIEPMFVSRPDGDEAALVTALEQNRILVIRAIAGQLTSISVSMLSQPSGATYMTSPPRAGVDPGPQTQILVAQGDTVFGAFFDPMKAPNPQTKCALRDEAAMPVNIRALGAYRPMGATYDDFLVLTEGGKLLVYDGVAFNGCATTQAPRPNQVKNLMFPGVQLGSQILGIKDTPFVLVQMHGDGGGRLGLYRINAGSIDEIGAPRDVDRLKTAALFEPAGDPKRYVLAGMPGSAVDGATAAGQVQVIEVDTATGVAATPAMTLFDAQPEDNQAFGRAVAQLPFNNKRIIAVAADNDVFLYFRTSLYGETREGR